MAVTITAQAPEYYIVQDKPINRKFISNIEASFLFKPEVLGEVTIDRAGRDTMIGQLLMQGRELTSPIRQYIWREKDDRYTYDRVGGTGLVTRTTNDFGINYSAVTVDDFDIDSNKPEEIQWIVYDGMTFTVADTAGNMDHGIVTAVAADGLTFTGQCLSGNGTWTVGTTNLDVVMTGKPLKDCECPPGLNYKKKNKVRENSMIRLGESYKYCDETEAEEGAGAYDLFQANGGYVYVDEKLDNKQEDLMRVTENAFLFGYRMSEAQATANGVERGTKGLFPILELEGAQKEEDYIETLADLQAIAIRLKRTGVRKATIRPNYVQHSKLTNILYANQSLQINPFQDNTNNMYYIGFKGIHVDGVDFIFKELSALDDISQNIGGRYTYVIIPEGDVTFTLNNRTQKGGYVNIVWRDVNGKVSKLKRTTKGDPGEDECGTVDVGFINNFGTLVVFPEKFIIGIKSGA